MSRITLLTDFGTADGYVAAMKGAITAIAPSVLIDDASHEIAPADIMCAALTLRRYWKLYPEGTVHVVVVDPGVGTARRAICAICDGRFIVAPDNGVASLVFEQAGTATVYEYIASEPAASNTFHGRDVFAPLAAQLANGIAIDELGNAISDALRITLPPPITTEDSVRGEIIHVDRFGNLISNIPAAMVPTGAVVRIADREVRIVSTYGDGGADEVVGLINSDGLLEIARPNGSAADYLSLSRGADLLVQR